MAEAAIPCSSGCTVQMGSIRDRRLPVKSRTERFLRPRRDTPSQSFAARLSFFTSRLASQGADYSLCVWILPGAVRRNDNFLDVQRLDPVPKGQAEDAIPVSD